MLFTRSSLSISLLALASPIAAQLPYNPTQLILSPDNSKVYQFSVQASQSSFAFFDITKQVTSSSTPGAVHQPIPFETKGRSFVPIADESGITVLVGNCQGSSKEATLWRFTYSQDGGSGSWKKLDFTSADTTLSANYLSAGFAFSAGGTTTDTSLYMFGGMCPAGDANATNWASQATYSNTMFSLIPGGSQSYDLSVTGSRSPPVAEAGLSITPLSPITTKSAAGKVSQQQNFILLGGHTQNAFINMSQVALFSLPEASWAFIGVNQPGGRSGELTRRDVALVEPRSGHSAILSDDGAKVIVLGGWVGDVNTPATPQLAILQLGQGYGGASSWQWTIPKQTESPISTEEGIYGHGAVMLPGNVMMVAGGRNIGPSKRKRSLNGPMFYHIDTGSWSSTYQNSTLAPSGLAPSQKAGLGAGLGLGLTAVILILVVWLLYRKRLRAKRAERERHLRELAFGSERFQSSSRLGSVIGGRVGQPEMRSASWGSRQEQEVESNGFHFPWYNQRQQQDKIREADHVQRAAQTGIEVPSPTRGLRKNLSLRGPAAFGNHFAPPTTGPGSVFRIDEVEEDGSVRSLRPKTPAESRLSDPFKDPPELEPTSAAEERKREVQGWVEDWQNAAVSMTMSRKTSRAKSPSNISYNHAHSDSSSYRTGRESPEKSDRTGSNLSERSEMSFQRSIGGISRQISQRSVSAGYALFTGATAALSKLGGGNRETPLERNASKRSISLQTTNLPKRNTSSAQRPQSGENSALLHDRSPSKSMTDDFAIRDFKNHSRTDSLTSQRKKTGIMGSVKRVLTGTSHVDVQAHVEHFEEKADDAIPPRTDPEMTDLSAPAFWRGKRGAKDWEDDGQPGTSNSNRRSTLDAASSVDDYDGDDWDVETAVQQRVVQVMFTVPKEKLRVVNADALSLMSRSDVDERETRERQAELNRMASLKSIRTNISRSTSQDRPDKGKGTEKEKEKESES